MKVDIQDVSQTKKILMIEITAEEINKEFEKTYEEIRRKIDVPGFRRGRAPRNILRVRFGEYVKNEVIREFVIPTCEKAIEDSKLEIIGSPDIYSPSATVLFQLDPKFKDDLDNNVISVELLQEFSRNNAHILDDAVLSIKEKGERWSLVDEKNSYRIVKEDGNLNVYLSEIPVKEGEPLTLAVAVSVKPEIKLPDYSELEVDKSDVDVTVDEVNKVIEELRAKSSVRSTLMDEKVQDGDIVSLDVKFVTGDGKIFRKTLEYEVRKDMNIPDLYQNLVGMAVGEEREFKARLPERFEEMEELAGQEVSVNIVLNRAERVQLPELDDEFAKDQGFESLEQLRGNIWNELVKKKRADKQDENLMILLDQLVEKTKFDVPEFLIQEELSKLLRERAQGEEIDDKSLEELRLEAEKSIRKAWIFEEIVKKEDIVVKDEEVEEVLMTMAARRNMEPRKYISIAKDTKLYERTRNSLLQGKVYDLLFEKASEKRGLIL